MTSLHCITSVKGQSNKVLTCLKISKAILVLLAAGSWVAFVIQPRAKPGVLRLLERVPCNSTFNCSDLCLQYEIRPAPPSQLYHINYSYNE